MNCKEKENEKRKSEKAKRFCEILDKILNTPRKVNASIVDVRSELVTVRLNLVV